MNHFALIALLLGSILLIGALACFYAYQNKRLSPAQTPSHSLAKWRPVMWLYVVSLLSLGVFWKQHLNPVLAQEVSPTSTAIPQSLPTSTPLPTLTPKPTNTRPPTETPLPIPDTGIIWNPKEEGVYLWQAPGQHILTWLINGAVIKFLDEWDAYGGLPWAWVSVDGQEGWVDATTTLRLIIPETGLTLVAGAGGYLFTEPQGQKITWLSPGTSLEIQEDQSSPTVEDWVQVTLPDRQIGWIPQTLIQVIFPTGQ